MVRRIRENDLWDEVYLSYTLKYILTSLTSFEVSASPLMQSYKLATLKHLQAFNDNSIPLDGTLSSLKSNRMAIASEMLGSLASNVNIEPPFFCSWGFNILLGENVYINRQWVSLHLFTPESDLTLPCLLVITRVSIYDNALVTIGNRVLIGPHVCICTETHDIDPLVRKEYSSFAFPIIIEDDVWIGARATILPGVRIGKGSMVAAGAVVEKDVESRVVVGGVPAKVIRKLSNESEEASSSSN
jgi:maltose O-acetyltransferase